jgi:integrase
MNDLGLPEAPDCNGIPIMLHPRAKKPRPDGAPKHASEEEIGRLFAAIDDPRNLAAFRIAYHAGLRAGEIGRLQWRDYSADTERVFIRRSKGSNSGEHRLCKAEAKALKAWLKIRGRKPGPLFFSRERTPLSRTMLHRYIQRYGELADWPAHLRHFHTLKHSCCVHLLSKGFNVEQVQDWVGHRRIDSTMVYARVTNPRRDEMAESLRDWR